MVQYVIAIANVKVNIVIDHLVFVNPNQAFFLEFAMKLHLNTHALKRVAHNSLMILSIDVME